MVSNAQKHDTVKTDALWTAAREGDAARIRHLIAEGVDVNVRNKDGWTPLHIATQYGHTEAMRTLISGKTMQNMSRAGLLDTAQPLTWNEALNSSKNAA